MSAPLTFTRRDALRIIAGVTGLQATPWAAFARETQEPETLPTSKEIEGILWEKILGAWYPRCLDIDHGGFHENFAHDWTRKRTRSKCLVYQGRMTWVPAHMAIHDERDRHQQRVYCAHGLLFLRRGMWDRKFGGFFDQVAPPGGPDPTVQPVKQLYSTAFGIYAAATGYQATKDPNARQLAQDAFVWIDEHAHDPEFGGYHEHLDREGKPLSLMPTDEDYRDRFMVIGKVGHKSMNAHIHILEALTALRRVWDAPILTSRLKETFLIVRDKIVMPGGHLNMFADRAFTPVDEASSFGHELEIAYLLAETDELLHGHVSKETAAVAKRLIDHSLKWGWDEENGGFFYEGPPTGQPDNRNKSWWVLPEAMNGLLTVAGLFPEERQKYEESFARTWKFFVEKQLDQQYGGCYGNLNEEGDVEPHEQDKANRWKTAYHMVRGLDHARQWMNRRSNKES